MPGFFFDLHQSFAMTPLAYNYLGEIAYEDELGSRWAGKNAKNIQPEAAESTPARFLRIFPSVPESSWLCALAWASQPSSRRLSIDSFFKITASGLPQEDRQRLLPPFIVDALHAFYRVHGWRLDSASASEASLDELEGLFSSMGLPKALAKIPSLANCAPPRAVLALRAAARLGEMPPLALAAPYFDPLDLTLEASAPPEGSSLPWSISPASRLVAPQGRRSAPIPIPTVQLDLEWLKILLASKVVCRSAVEAIEILRASHATELGLSGRHPYPPITRANETLSSVSSSLLLAHRKLARDIAEDTPDWDQRVAALVGIPEAELRDRLSAEQIDACGIAARNFAARKSFILADETGLGKGRALAALAKAFLATGRPVAFITEKKHLFSDFWRDLCDVYGDSAPPLPFLLHPKGRVLSACGEVVAKTPSAAKYKQQLATHSSSSPLLFSTYSQFNRDAKHADKHMLIEAHLKGGLLILDESHNASGESQTRANILALLDASEKCIFSSATYAKHEHAFELYSSATPLSRNEMALLLSSFAGADPLAASNAIAHGLVRIGSMVRREHLPDANQDSRIVEPSAVEGSGIGAERQKLHEALDGLFALQEALDKAKWRAGEETDASWMKLGGVLARLCRQFNLLSKIDLACETAAALLAEGKKPVIALESTFEAFLRAQLAWGFDRKLAPSLLASEEEAPDDDAPAAQAMESLPDLSFCSLFKLVIESVAPPEDLARLRDPAIAEAKSRAFSLAGSLPQWLASPIDLLRANISARGFSVGEISGRGSQIDIAPDGSLSLRARSSDERESIVRQFNHGSIDVLILTQAGASGISLHAAAQFSDRRPRAFMELEICANPSQRVQFLGRVRRKGQVAAPEYLVVSSGSPYEHRLIERATSKQRILSGLTSATQDMAAGSLTLASQILTPRGDRVAVEWLRSNHHAARKLGIDPANPVGKTSLDTAAERLLKRLPLLSSAQQDEIFSFMTSALAIDQKIPLPGHEASAYLNRPVLARSSPICGPASAMEKSFQPSAFEPTIYAQEWICAPPSAHLGSAAVQERLRLAEERMKRGFVESLAAAANKMLRQPGLSLEIHARMQNMSSAAGHLAPGAKIRISHPDTGRPLDGMIIDIEPPPNDKWTLYPSQWKICAIFPGQPFEMALSLAAFLADRHAYLEKSAPPPERAWSDHAPRPYHFATVDGHCGYSRWYAAQFDAAATTRFDDAHGVAHELNTFAFDATIEAIKAWKIPLIDPRLSLQLLQRDTQLVLDNSPRSGSPPTCSLAPTGGGWMLCMERSLHDATIDFALDRRLGPRKYATENGVQVVRRFVSARDIHSAIPMLHLRGCKLFAPPTRARWHATALELLLAIAKPAKKGKTRR